MLKKVIAIFFVLISALALYELIVVMKELLHMGITTEIIMGITTEIGITLLIWSVFALLVLVRGLQMLLIKQSGFGPRAAISTSASIIAMVLTIVIGPAIFFVGTMNLPTITSVVLSQDSRAQAANSLFLFSVISALIPGMICLSIEVTRALKDSAYAQAISIASGFTVLIFTILTILLSLNLH